MNIRLMRSLKLGCLLIWIFWAAAPADYHYVSHTGSDEYPYTSWETAADSVHDAAAAADPGDTVYIASGEYEGPVVVNPADCPISIIGAGMDSTHLFTRLEQNLITFGGDTYVRGLQFSTVRSYAALTTFVAGADITVEDCAFAGTGHGILPVACVVVVRNCIFENLHFVGIFEPFSTNPSLEVTNCLFRNMYVEPINVETHRAVLRNNIVVNTCAYEAFHLFGAEGGYVSITNNVIYDVCSGGMLMFGVDDTTSRVENNTLYDATTYIYSEFAISVAPGFEWRLANNSITGCDGGVLLYRNLPLAVHYSNLWNNDRDFAVNWSDDGTFDTTYGLIHADPMFADPDSGDFRLQAFSPLIDAGDPNILDVDGSRSDIGAYGGQGGSSYVYQDLPPRVPDSLTYRVWNDTIYLDWRSNTEADFFGYLVHRDTLAGFTPSPLNLIAEPESSLYADGDVALGQTYYYRIAALDNQGNRSDYSPEIAITVTGIWQGDGAEIPRMTIIESNYPNPFNSTTTIIYTVANLGPIPAEIVIEIYDIMGRKVRTLVNERKEVGRYSIAWDGTGDSGEALTSGTYFARISQWGLGFLNKPKKLVLLK